MLVKLPLPLSSPWWTPWSPLTVPAALARSLSTVRVFPWQGWCDLETKGVNSRKGKARELIHSVLLTTVVTNRGTV